MSVKRIVIDASVALKWQLRDDGDTAQADQLLDDYLNGSLQLLAPSLFDYEITNALRSALLRGRISQDEAVAALEHYRGLGIEKIDFASFQGLAFDLACRHQRSAYDSAYMALALSSNVWFYTGDLRLFNAVSGTLAWVKWIGDYQLDAIPEIAGTKE